MNHFCHRGVAQLAARHVRDVEVGSSSLLTPTVLPKQRSQSASETSVFCISAEISKQSAPQAFACGADGFGVGVTGFEPATTWSQTRCATGLRYAPRDFRPGSGSEIGAKVRPFPKFSKFLSVFAMEGSRTGRTGRTGRTSQTGRTGLLTAGRGVIGFRRGGTCRGNRRLSSRGGGDRPGRWRACAIFRERGREWRPSRPCGGGACRSARR